jgi:hypothetical protein
MGVVSESHQIYQNGVVSKQLTGRWKRGQCVGLGVSVNLLTRDRGGLRYTLNTVHIILYAIVSLPEPANSIRKMRRNLYFSP